MNVLKLFSSIRTFRTNYSNAFQKARKAMSTSWKTTGGPSPFGQEIIIKNNIPKKDIKKLQSFGYHAGSRDSLISQVKAGSFEDVGKDIYFAKDPTDAAHFGAMDFDPKTKKIINAVIVKLCSTNISRENEIFGHYYVDSGEGNYIERAWHVNPEYQKYKNTPELRMSDFTRIKMAFQSGLKTFIETIKRSRIAQ